MDNTQAAAVLRENAEYCRVNGPKDRAEAYSRGANALEMLEWLFGNGVGHIDCLAHGWLKLSDDDESTFRAFCEARFEESKNA